MKSGNYCIVVMGKNHFHRLVPHERFAVVSIRNHNDSSPKEELLARYEKMGGQYLDRVMRIGFDDVERSKVQVMGPIYQFGIRDQQAFEIAKYLKACWEDEIYSYIFQCEAGISRSAGCAKAWQRYLEEHGQTGKFKSFMNLCPNNLVQSSVYDYLIN